MREIEIKLRAPDLEVVAAKLKELGCTISEPKTQEDRNFIHKDDVNWFAEPGVWVYPRLRIESNKLPKLTVKKPLRNEMDCIEHEIEVNDVDEATSIMKMFDYIPGVTVIKTRRTCIYKEYTITLDNVERLGGFVEIERVLEDGDAEKIQEEMFSFAKEILGLERDESIMKGYDILMYHLYEKI